jgi:hypothetical protein
MFAFLTKLLLVVGSRLRSQARLQAEILVLRQQVLILSWAARSSDCNSFAVAEGPRGATHRLDSS